jgi:hypothetical protein
MRRDSTPAEGGREGGSREEGERVKHKGGGGTVVGHVLHFGEKESDSLGCLSEKEAMRKSSRSLIELTSRCSSRGHAHWR